MSTEKKMYDYKKDKWHMLLCPSVLRDADLRQHNQLQAEFQDKSRRMEN